MSLEIPALNLNQWILAGFIVLVTILLLGWVFLWISSSRFRHALYRDLDTSPRIERHTFTRLWEQEMYRFWVGNILDLVQSRAGRGQPVAGKIRFLSVTAWILLLVCIAGYAGAFWSRDMWGFFGLLIILASIGYCRITVIETFRTPDDDST